MHFPSKENNFFNGVVFVILFGITLSGLVFVSGKSKLNICENYFSNHKTICHLGVGFGSSALLGVAWPRLPTIVKSSIGLFDITVTSAIFMFQLDMRMWTELVMVYKHMWDNLQVPMKTSKCMMHEAAYTVAQIKQTLFGESDMAKVNKGVNEVVSGSFKTLDDQSKEFEQEVLRSFQWLKVFGDICNNAVDELMKDGTGARLAGSGVVKFIFCNSFERLDWIMKTVVTPIIVKIKGFMDNLVRMRYGIIFEYHSTNYVEDELRKAFGWDTMLTSFENGGNFLEDLFNFCLDYVYPNLSVIFAFGFIFYYQFRYRFGKLKFDNKYVPEDYEDRPTAGVQEPKNKQFLPLKYYETIDNLQMVPGVIATPNQWSKYNSTLLTWKNLLIIGFVFLSLVIDWGFTEAGHLIYIGIVNLYNKYQGKLFDYRHNDDLKGFQRFFQFLADKLDEMQQAAGLGRIVGCYHRPPPILYDFAIFIGVIIWRILFFTYARVKLHWLASMIVGHYFPNHHEKRMEFLKDATLIRRDFDAPTYPSLFTFYIFPIFSGLSGMKIRWPGFIKDMSFKNNFFVKLLKMNRQVGGE